MSDTAAGHDVTTETVRIPGHQGVAVELTERSAAVTDRR
jgi:hypothetical protein